MVPVNLDAGRYAEIMARGSEHALQWVLKTNGVTKKSIFELERLNTHAATRLSTDDILFPLFATLLQGVFPAEASSCLEAAYVAWRSGNIANFRRNESTAREEAFNLIVQQHGFSIHSFSPIPRSEPQVLLPFFHVMIQQCKHITMETAMLRSAPLSYESDMHRAFAWYHFDYMYTFYKSKGVDVIKYL